MPSFDSAKFNADGPISQLSDRRKQSRRSLRGTAFLLIPQRPPVAVRIADIGPSGISIVAALNAPADAECRIRFPLPRGLDIMQIETTVVVAQSVFSSNDDGFRVGLRFKNLTDEQTTALRSYVAASAA